MKRFFLLLSLITFLALFHSLVHGANLITKDDFEEGRAWTYATHWTNDYGQGSHIHTTSANPNSGTYCAETDIWYRDGTIGDNPMFIYGSLPTNTNQIFIRFWFRAGPNYSNYWNEFMRFTATSGSDEIEIGSGVDYGTTTSVHIYNSKYNDVTWNTIWGNYKADTSWTQFAILIDYSNNQVVLWKNQTSYIKEKGTVINCAFQDHYRRVVLPTYLKRVPPGSLNTVFYMDDIEIWDGMPDSIPAPKAPSGLKIVN
jgi:hypothetical protein